MGYYSANGDTECRICQAGYYCSSPATEQAVSALNYAPAGSTFQRIVPHGYKYVDSGTEPVKCSGGTYWRASDATCPECAAGQFCPTDSNGLVGAAALTVPSGFYTDAAGSENAIMTPPGFKSTSVSAAPTACGAGEFSLGGTTTCTQCPSGYECSNPGAVPVKCPGGTYSAAGASSCTECPAGSECPFIASSTTNVCTSGTYYQDGAEPGEPAVCIICPPGH